MTHTHTLTRRDVATVEGLASALSMANHKLAMRAKFMQELPLVDGYAAKGIADGRAEFAQALATLKADFEELTTFLAERGL